MIYMKTPPRILITSIILFVNCDFYKLYIMKRNQCTFFPLFEMHKF